MTRKEFEFEMKRFLEPQVAAATVARSEFFDAARLLLQQEAREICQN